MKAATLALTLALGQGWFSDPAPAPQVRMVKTERIRTPRGMPDVYVVHDDLRGVTCYITHSENGGGGIACLPTPAITVEKGK